MDSKFGPSLQLIGELGMGSHPVCILYTVLYVVSRRNSYVNFNSTISTRYESLAFYVEYPCFG